MSRNSVAKDSTDFDMIPQPQLYWITKPGDPSTTFIPMRTNNRFYYFLGRNVGTRKRAGLGLRR
jgi:hypothetical protein